MENFDLTRKKMIWLFIISKGCFLLG